MADRWIIAKHRFHEHVSLDAARTEFARLGKEFPEQKFRILRIKTALTPSDAGAVIGRLQEAIATLIVAHRDGNAASLSSAIEDAERTLAETGFFPPSSPNVGDHTVVPPSPPSPETNLNEPTR